MISRKIPSIVANWLIGKIIGVPITDNGCSLKAYRAEVIKSIPLYSEMHRFIPAMASITGCRISEIPVRHHARKFGKTKYGLSRIYKILLDLLKIKLIVSFISRPLIWFGGIAMVAGACSLFFIILAMIIFSYDPKAIIVIETGVAILFGSLSLFSVLAGILCEQIYKTGNLKLGTLSRIKATMIGFDELGNGLP